MKQSSFYKRSNRNEQIKKKIVVPISLTLTGCLVVAAFVLNDSLTKVDANVAFNGISDIVSSHGKDKPFNIVEVVPDKKMASIGYLIDGQEPDDWFGTLSKMSDKDGAGVKIRSAYMEGLKTKLAPITTEKRITQSLFTMSRMRRAMSVRAMTGQSLPL